MALTPAPWFGLEHLESRQLLAAISWDGGGGDNNWTNPLNWSGDVLPTLNDNVAIDSAQSPIRISQGDAALAYFLNSSVPLNISGGQLTVAGPWAHHAALTMSGGSLSIGLLSLDGDMMWTGGSIMAGRGYNLAGHRFTIDGNVSLASLFENDGTIEWRSGNLVLQGQDAPSLINSAGSTFLIHSSGTLNSPTGTNLINRGTLILDAPPGATTTIAIQFSNERAFGSITNPESGTVDVRSGTLAFTADVVEKQGTTLAGGNWYVSSSTARLLLPGPDIITASGTFVLNGAGASFPALEHASSIENLTLSGGRAFTFNLLNPSLYTINSVTIDNPGMTTIIPVLRASNLLIRGGRVDILNGFTGGLMTSRIQVDAGTVLVLSGISRIPNADISGAGLIRVKGELNWPSGTITGPGQLVITETGHFTTNGVYFELFDKLLTRRVINRGTMDWSESTYNIQFSGEVVNRGIFNLSILGYLSTSAGIGPGYAPAYITNFGIINSTASLTVRGAGGAVRLFNQGTVHVVSGVLIFNGGSYGGGNWVVDAGAELVFGGFGSILVNASMSGAGRIREAAAIAWWTNPLITGTGDLLVTVPGTLALLGTSSSITRSTVTNNGQIYLHQGTVTRITANFINNANLQVNDGTLDITGNMTLTAASSLFVRSTPPVFFAPPRISVSGAATVNGALTVSFNWSPPLGTNFDFLYAGTPGGEFSAITGLGLPNGGVAIFFFVGNYGRLSITIF